MFASVSHEFRTPLNAFENSLNLIKMQFDEVLDDAGPFLNQETRLRVDEHTARIEKFLKMGTISSRLLMNLVEDILDLEKFDSGVFALNIGSFKLGELIQDIRYIFEEQCHERGFYFEVLPENESLLDRFFVSDQGRIRQVLINLISNAVKFTHAGGIQVILEQKKSAKGIQLWFSVKDSGVGINKKKANLFQMFRMVQAHRKEINQHGTGIGLHISKKIVESLGGEIDYESEESVGSIFSFYITPYANPALPSPTSLTLPSEFLSESILPINPHFKDPNRSKFLC
ncbi:unnamed protein product [Moneuplotes crassus]|uniref:histidine kinase n=1 Tax=Euplotes crassus TaxID=5936 RepID=A0AAD2DCC1_EUPCR|nr:unnamed protein product [Moneuplotes crassus]